MITRTEEERVKLREVGARLAQILSTLRGEVKPGVHTRDIDLLAERLVLEGGDRPALKGYRPRFARRPYPSTVCISVNDEVVHGIPSENDRVLEEGDVVGLDLVIEREGFFVDAAVTTIAGKGDESAQRLITATEVALAAGIHAAKVGGRLYDISAAIEDSALEQGYGVVYELGGHGVGRAVHEEPMIPNIGTPGEGPFLEDGMVLAIEPMLTEGESGKVRLLKDGYTYVTKDGTRAAHVEHSVLLTKDGPEILTRP